MERNDREGKSRLNPIPRVEDAIAKRKTMKCGRQSMREIINGDTRYPRVIMT